MTSRSGRDDALRDPAIRAFVWAMIALTTLVCRAPQTPEELPPGEARPVATPGGATLVTDSSQYTVRLEGGMYRATIGYTFTNRSGNAVSANYCRTPPPPALEKRVGGGWVRAYSPVSLLCLTQPPFRIAAGATYRGTLDFAAAPRGGNVAPELEVDSIPGVYRLRWTLRAGQDPDAPGTGTVEAISNEFRLVER